MSGLNQRGPENMDPMTGRKMGSCARPKSETGDSRPMNRGLGLRRCPGACGYGRGRGYGKNFRRISGVREMPASLEKSRNLSDR